MPHDLALAQRRAWLQSLARRRHPAWHREIAYRLAGWMVPARRRARHLVRDALVHL